MKTEETEETETDRVRGKHVTSQLDSQYDNMIITDQWWRGTVVLSRAVEVVLFDVGLVDSVGNGGATRASLWRTQSVPSDTVVLRSDQVKEFISRGLEFLLSLKQFHQVFRRKHQICLLLILLHRTADLPADLTLVQQN